MISFSRLVFASAIGSFALVAVAYAAPPQRVMPVQDTAPLVATQATQGYLGIVCTDVTNDRAATLKLKAVTGAEILNVDRDAPAGKAGLLPHDVILQMNGQNVAGEEMLRRMLRETPSGRSITLLISREGQQQSVTVQLADRALLEEDAFSEPMVIPAPDDDDTLTLEGPSGRSFGSGFFGIFSLGSPAVGVELDVLGTQLADYFGVKDGQGLLVKHVAEDSPASRAGLKAGDVITEANGQKMPTLGTWMKMLHANRGHAIPLVIVRDRKQQTLTLLTGNGKNHSQLLLPANPTLFISVQ
ncbi:MAG TPA: PDZ domain-containing protein [Acidobacteriaceae bacterium]|nr:PDZ domain-containing protein [Acidobacteriaceae bacterium]